MQGASMLGAVRPGAPTAPTAAALAATLTPLPFLSSTQMVYYVHVLRACVYTCAYVK